MKFHLFIQLSVRLEEIQDGNTSNTHTRRPKKSRTVTLVHSQLSLFAGNTFSALLATKTGAGSQSLTRRLRRRTLTARRRLRCATAQITPATPLITLPSAKRNTSFTGLRVGTTSSVRMIFVLYAGISILCVRFRRSRTFAAHPLSILNYSCRWMIGSAIIAKLTA